MKYERLTTKDKDGNWQVWEDDYSHPFEALQTAIDKLAELEDKIENGTLIKLPCKVGDDAYFVIKHEEDWLIEIGYVTAISIDKDGIWIACRYSSGLSYWHNRKDKKLFFNCAEAEKKLKELKGEV